MEYRVRSSSVDSLLAYSAYLTSEEKVDLLCGLSNQLNFAESKKVIKFIQRKRGQQSQNLRQSVHETSLNQVGKEPLAQPEKPFNFSAWRSPLIFRGDQIPYSGKLFMDVEKVSLKKKLGEKKHKLVAATIAVVNEEGTLILWAFIKYDRSEVCQYFTGITGLEESSLDEGVSLITIQELLKQCLLSNTIVGFQIREDLRSLGVDHNSIEELQDFFKSDKGQPISVRNLAKEFLNGKEIQTGIHSAITDARVTLALHKVKQDFVINQAINVLSLNLSPLPKGSFLNYGKRCHCDD